MRRLLVSQLRHRRGRAAALGLAILVAAASFTLLTASARTSTLHVRRTLTRNFRGAYDILVRPKGSFTPLEREQGLVRDNYLSGIYGGITLRQYREIERLPGVEVAAPIANIGTVLPFGQVKIPLTALLTKRRYQLFRVRLTWVAQRGLSRYPATDLYIYVTRDRFVKYPPGPTYWDVYEVAPGHATPLRVCNGFALTQPQRLDAFVPSNSTSLACYSYRVSPALAAGLRRFGERDPSATQTAAFFGFAFPIALAAIDPVQEAKLVHLDRTIVSGRYLRESDGPYHNKTNRFVPVIVGSRSYLGERLDAAIERLRVPPGTDVPRMLASGSCEAFVDPCPKALPAPPRAPAPNAYRFLVGLPGSVVARRSYPAGGSYTSAISAGYDPYHRIETDSYFTGSPVQYRRLGTTALRPLAVTNDEQVWFSDYSQSSYLDQPTDNLDVAFRKLRGHPVSNLAPTGGLLNTPFMRAVGRFDPRKLPGFSPLSRVPLETYYPPQLVGADTRSRRLLHDRSLLPSQNIGGYVQQPPLMLTTLSSLKTFLNPDFFANVDPRIRRAPISVIRVRVAGVTGTDRLSQERIRVVAQSIHDRTGLAVDVTAGSSPTPITIDLPRGKFGRPALELSEGWVKKGVAVSYLRALDRKDLALFALILVVCVLFLGNGAFAAVRVRRGEIGALSTLGWSPREIFVSVLGELALVGLAAGLLGTGLAAALVHWLALDFPLLRVLYVLPIAVGLAVLAGLVPAWRAARGRPLDAVGPPVSGARRARHVRGIGGIALVNLARLPGRTLVGAAGLVLGVAALTMLVGIERGFSGTLVGTLLGSAISVQVRGADFVALALTLALSALSAADVLHLNLRERRGELVTLRTLGWSESETRRLVALEALWLVLGASVVGAAIGILVGALVLGVGLPALGVAAAIAGGGAALAAFAASLLPVLRLHRLAAPEVLAAE